MARPAAALAPLVLALLAAGACRTPDPKQELELTEIETYWAIDPSVGQTNYLAPVVRFHVRNKGAAPLGYVQATATFRRAGEGSRTWGSAFQQLASSARPLAPGRDTIVELKSDARYFSAGTPQSMFEHKLFRDATVEVFLRVGSSSWVKMGQAAVERRIGSRSATLAP